MASSKKIGAIIALDGEAEFKKSVQSVVNDLKEINSESKLVEEQFKGQKNTAEALSAQHDVLSKSVEAHKAKEEALSKAMENAKQNQDKIKSGLEKLRDTLDKEKSKLEELKATYGESSDEVKAQEERIKALSSEIEKGEKNYEKSGDRIQKWQTQLNEAQAETLKANSALEKNEQYLEEAESATDKCAKSIDEFGKEVSDTNDDVDESSDTLGSWKEKLESALGAGIIEAGTEALEKLGEKAKEAAEYAYEVGSAFESAISQVAAISGASESEIEALSEKAQEMGSTTQFSASEAAEAMNYMAMAGWDTSQMLGGIEGIMNLAAASGEDLATTSDIVTDALTAFGLSASDSGHFADVLAAASSNANTNVSMMGETFQYAAPLAGALGFSIEDVSEAIGLMANSGIKSSQAGTSLRKIFTSLSGEVEICGASIGNVNIATTNADGSMRSLSDILADCREAFSQLSESEQTANAKTIVGTNAMSGFLALMNAAPSDVEKLSSAIAECDGAAEDMATTMNDNLQGKITIMQSALEGLGISAYDSFSEPLSDSVEKATGVIEELTDQMTNGELGEAFGSLADLAGDGAEALLGVADGLVWIINHGDAIIATLEGIGSGLLMYKAITVISDVATKIKALTAFLQEAEVAQEALNAAQIANPYALVAAGIATLGVALVSYANKKCKAVQTESEKTYKSVQKLAESAEELKSSLEETTTSQDEAVKSTTAQYTASKTLVDELYKVNDALSTGTMSESESAAAKYKINQYVEQLKGSYSGLNLTIDEETGLLKENKQAVEDQIEALKDQAMLSLMQDQLTELYQQQAEAKIDQTEATIALDDAQKANNDTLDKATASYNAYVEMCELANSGLYSGIDEQEQYQQELQKIADKYGVTIDEMTNGYNAVNQAAVDTGNYQSAMEDAQKAVDDATEAEQDAEAAIDLKREAIAELMKQMGYSKEEIEELTGITIEGTEATNEATEANEDYAESTEEIVASADAQKEALESLRDKYKEIKDDIQQSMEEKVDLFDTFDGGETYDLDEVAQNLADQEDQLNNWADNMETLAGQIGSSMNVELYEKLMDLGPEYANFTQQLVDCLDPEKGGSEEQLKAIADQYAESLDITDKASDVLSATQAVIKTMLGEMSDSTEVDFSGLTDSLDDAVAVAAESGEAISSDLRQEFLDTVETAKEIGAEIPEGLADSLSSGDVSVSDAVSQLRGSIEAQFTFLSELAEQAGLTIPDDIKAGIESGGQDAVDAIEKLREQLLQKQTESTDEFTQAGSDNTKAVAEGTEAAKSEVVQQSEAVVVEAAQQANSQALTFTSVGNNMMAGVAAGLNQNSQLVYDAVTKILNKAKEEANKATDSHSPSRIWRNQVGAYMSQGLALGISDGEEEVSKAAVNLAKTALTATKDELEIKSPSKKFKKQVGKQISSGVAYGIKEGTGDAKKSAKELASEVYSAAEEWLKKKKELGNVTVEEELYMWDKLIAAAKKKGKKYKAQIKKLATEAKQEVKSTAVEYGVSGNGLSEYKKLYDVSAKAEVQYWKKVLKSKKLSDEQRLEATQSLVEAQESYYEQLEELEEDYADKCSEVNEKLQEEVESLNETYTSTLSERKSAIKDAFGMFDEFSSESESADVLLENMQSQVEGYELWMEQLEELQKRGIVSDAWMEDLQNLGPDNAATIVALNQATDEQLKAMQEAYDAKDLLAQQQAEKELTSLKTETNEKIKALTEAAQSELDTYYEEYKASYDKLSEPISGTLEKIAKNATTLGETATKNLILSMTKTVSTKDTQTSLSGITKTVADAIGDVSTSMKVTGKNAVTTLVNRMEKQAKDKETAETLQATKETIKSGLSGLTQSGKNIGKNMLDGLLINLNDEKKIKKSAADFVDTLEAAIKKEAGIASPSKRFRDVIGKQIPAGVAVGIEEDTDTATEAGTKMVSDMLEAAEEQMKQQQAGLALEFGTINAGAGIATLNDLTSGQTQLMNTVTVNNTGVAEIMAGMVSELRSVKDEIANMKVVLDTGTLVGEIAEPVGDALTAQVLRGW